MSETPDLFVFGMGYSAGHYARTRAHAHGRVWASVRSREKRDRLRAQGFGAFALEDEADAQPLRDALARCARVLVSTPPVATAAGEAGDPTLAAFGEALRQAPALARIVYLSTVGVYGDHSGAWIDESAQPRPSNQRSLWRLAAEAHWLALGAARGAPAHVLRLAGIYGPGQNALVNLKAGTAKRIVKPGQVFNRIHVEDIARAIDAAFLVEGPGAAWNVSDDEPAPPQDVVAYAAQLLGVAPPPEIAFETAQLSPMARSFYGECKRVSNRAMKERLGVRLAYPTYREALRALLEAGEGR